MAGKPQDEEVSTKLTAKQREFCEEYVATYNTVQTYLKVFDTVDYKTASRNGIKLLKKPEILEYIKQLQKEAIERAAVSAEKYIKELDRMAFDYQKTSEAGRLRAIELLSKMEGFNAPDKVEAKVATTTITVGFEDDEH